MVESPTRIKKQEAGFTKQLGRGVEAGLYSFLYLSPYPQSACTNSSPCTCTALINLNLFVFVGGCVMFMLPKEDFKINLYSIKIQLNSVW